MALREQFSNGKLSVVHKTSSRDRVLFPSADVVRNEQTKDKWWFARLFYKHKIASLLFPQNVIDVVGATVDPAERAIWGKSGPGEFSGLQNRENFLFSRMAQTVPGHEIYASHMTVGYKKESTCPCEACGSHRQMHGEAEAARALALHDSTVKMGIGFPYDDPSDYCLVDGEILFFEVPYLDSARLRKYLGGLPDLTVDTKRVLTLLDRYDAFSQMSKAEKKIGRSVVITN